MYMAWWPEHIPCARAGDLWRQCGYTCTHNRKKSEKFTSCKIVEFNIVTFNFLSPNQGVSMYGLVAGYNPHHPTMVPGMMSQGQGLSTHIIRLREKGIVN